MNLTQNKVCQLNYYMTFFFFSKAIMKRIKSIIITYILSSSFKMMIPCCQQSSLLKKKTGTSEAYEDCNWLDSIRVQSLKVAVFALSNWTRYHDKCMQVSNCLIDLMKEFLYFCYTPDIKYRKKYLCLPRTIFKRVRPFCFSKFCT